MYTYVRDDTIQAYAVPIDTRGLWGQIHGYLAIDNDGVTIRGFYGVQAFRNPRTGGRNRKPLVSQKPSRAKKLWIKAASLSPSGIAKGKVAEMVPDPRKPNYVDGISGATMTGKFLTAGLKEILRDYETRGH